jgi:hypothetical protein
MEGESGKKNSGTKNKEIVLRTVLMSKLWSVGS